MKAIVLARVSTVNQSLEQQTKELVQTARKDGYNDILIIENKESAIKNDEEHRLGLVEMKQAILNDSSITCVYCREVSRIGRRYDVLTSIKAFFVSHKIQLIVCGNTRIELLDSEKNVTLVGGLMFEIACQTATQEMQDKKIRFEQGKRKANSQGKIASGKPLFGYYTNSDGYIKINEVEAEVVREIFDTYTSTDVSTLALYRDLQSKGKIKRYKSEQTGRNFIERIIKNKAYSGGISNSNGDNPIYINRYDAIVSSDIQETAIAKCKGKRTQSKTLTKYTYYCKSLIKCTCGFRMVANSSSFTYICPHCKKGLPINQLDYIAWSEAQAIKSLQMINDSSADKKKAELTISDNIKKIETSKKRLDELDELEVNVIDSSLNISNKEKRDLFVARKLEDVTSERKQINNNILQLETTNRQLQEYLTNIDGKRFFDPITVEDSTQRKEIIDSVISSISIEDIDDKHVKITINPKKSVYPLDWVTYYIYDKSTLPYPRLIRYTENLVEDVTKQVTKRFDRVNKKMVG